MIRIVARWEVVRPAGITVLVTVVFAFACGGREGPGADAGAIDARRVDGAQAPDASVDASTVDANVADAVPADASPCGNGDIDEGEECEGMDLGGRDCVDLGFDLGALDCGVDCRFDTTGCLQIEICDNGLDDDGDAVIDCEDSSCAGEPPCPRCGDGVADPGEECDDPDLRGYGCEDVGFAGGTLACFACLFDTTACTDEFCSNGADDDGDGYIDCGDLDCDPHPACGPTPTGDPCTGATECQGGVCLDEPVDGFPSGYCSGLCDLTLGLCGGDTDSWCWDDGSSLLFGHCFAVCTVGGTDCRAGYRCQDTMMGTGICLPE